MEKWENVLHLYDQLLQISWSPIAALHRTFALSKIKGKSAAVAEAEKLNLVDNQFYYLMLGELNKDMDNGKAKENFEKAFLLAKTDAGRKAIQLKIEKL